MLGTFERRYRLSKPILIIYRPENHLHSNSAKRGKGTFGTINVHQPADRQQSDIQSPKTTYQRRVPVSRRLPRRIPSYEKTIFSPSPPPCTCCTFNPLVDCSHAACSCSPLSGLIKTPFPLLLFARARTIEPYILLIKSTFRVLWRRRSLAPIKRVPHEPGPRTPLRLPLSFCSFS